MLAAILGLAGALLIVAALVGGGFTFSGSVVPRIGRMTRIPCFVVGSVLVIIAFALAVTELTSNTAPAADSPPTSTTTSETTATAVPLPDSPIPLGEVVEAVYIYEEPYLDAPIVGHLEPGAIIEILCTAYGESVTYAPAGLTSNLWNGVTGGYVPDVVVYTGTNEPTAGSC
nr:hypothetical protein GCM10017745_35730 [Saccharothrix mutabilis subsp. capreolus]